MQNVAPADDFENEMVAEDGSEDPEQEEAETDGFFGEEEADDEYACDEEGELDAVLTVEIRERMPASMRANGMAV